MRAVIYMRVGNPEQLSVRHPAEASTGKIQDTRGDSPWTDICTCDNIPGLQDFYKKSRGMTGIPT